MQTKRAGEAVRGAVLTGGVSSVALADLLEPWLSRALDLMAAATGVSLPEGYHLKAVVAVTAAMIYIAATIKVRLLQPVGDSGALPLPLPPMPTPPPPPPPPSALGLS